MSQFITRPLTASELARLQIYASLITHLRFDQDDSIHSYLLARLKFPNVSVLECVGRRIRDIRVERGVLMLHARSSLGANR